MRRARHNSGRPPIKERVPSSALGTQFLLMGAKINRKGAWPEDRRNRRRAEEGAVQRSFCRARTSLGTYAGPGGPHDKAGLQTHRRPRFCVFQVSPHQEGINRIRGDQPETTSTPGEHQETPESYLLPHPSFPVTQFVDFRTILLMFSRQS